MADDITRNRPGRQVRSGVRLSEVIERVSWGAVWSGVMVALAMEMLFTVFGLFVGFGMYNWQAADPWTGIRVWSTVWYLVTAGWSMFFGAWCAARLSGNASREAAVLHGITTWGLASVATIAIVTVGTWSALGRSVEVLQTGPMTRAELTPNATELPAQTPQVTDHGADIARVPSQSSGPIAQAVANVVAEISLRIWGGVLLGFITALLGGWFGCCGPRVVDVLEVPPDTQLAA